MADLSKIKIPNGTEYNLKDAQARADIESLNGSLDTKLDAPPSAGTVTDVYNTFFAQSPNPTFNIVQNPDLSCDVKQVNVTGRTSSQVWAAQQTNSFRLTLKPFTGFISFGSYSSDGVASSGRIAFSYLKVYLLIPTGHGSTLLKEFDHNLWNVGDVIDISMKNGIVTINDLTSGTTETFSLIELFEESDALSGTYADNFLVTSLCVIGLYKNSTYAGKTLVTVLNTSAIYDANGNIDTDNTITVTTSEEGSIVVSNGAGGTKWGSVLGKSHWSGKTWYAYGTSLTNIASEGKYASELASISGLTLVNKGISGGGIIANRRIYDALLDNTDGKVNADLITIEVGANDSASPLGTPLDLTNDTFCGSLNVCIKNILTNCPKAQVIIMPSTRGRYALNDPTSLFDIDTPASGGFTFVERDEAMRKVALANGIYFIPLSALGLGIYRMQTGDTYNVDNVHHTKLGGYNLAQGIWGYLKNIPLWYTAIPE